MAMGMEGRGGVWREGVGCGGKGWGVEGRGGVWREGVGCGGKGWGVEGRGGVWREGVGCGGKGWGVEGRGGVWREGVGCGGKGWGVEGRGGVWREGVGCGGKGWGVEGRGGVWREGVGCGGKGWGVEGRGGVWREGDGEEMTKNQHNSLPLVRGHVIVLVHLVRYLLDGLCSIVGKVQVPHLLGRHGYNGEGFLVLLVGRQPHLVHHRLVTVLIDGDGGGMHPGIEADMMEPHV